MRTFTFCDVIYVEKNHVLPEILNSCGLAFEKSFEVEAGLGLVQEDDLNVDVVTSRMEEIGLQFKMITKIIILQSALFFNIIISVLRR